MALLTLAASAGSLHAQAILINEQRALIMLDDTLSGELVELVDLDQTTLTIRDQSGRTLSRERSEVIALLPAWWQPDALNRRRPVPATPPADLSAKFQGYLELVDGQRVPGRPVTGADPQDESVLWTHSVFGPIRFSLESVSTMVLDPASTVPPPLEADDLVVLKNGDRLAGFVEGLQPEVVVSASTGTINLPLQNIASVQLLNEPTQPDGALLWTDDRSVIGLRGAEYDEDSQRLGVLLRGSTENEARYVERERLVGIGFDAQRIVALSALPIESQTPIGRTWAPPVTTGNPAGVPFGAADLRLSGPTEITWTLPDDTIRLAGHAALRPEALLWGDCTVTIEALDRSGRAIATSTARVNGEMPLASFNLAISNADEATLRLRVEPGEHGPIQDWITIHRAILLLDTP